jgi:hypothetical protein
MLRLREGTGKRGRGVGCPALLGGLTFANEVGKYLNPNRLQKPEGFALAYNGEEVARWFETERSD